MIACKKSSHRWKYIATYIGLVVLFYFTYGPIGSTNGLPGSDMAIPTIMANGEQTPYSIYFYGQDRFGGWPYMMMGSVAHILAIDWLPHHTFFAQILVYAWALLLIALAFGHFWFVIPLGLLSVLDKGLWRNLSPDYLFAWQLIGIAWFIYQSRKKTQSRIGYLFLFLASFLAQWMSPTTWFYLSLYTSGPFILRLYRTQKVRLPSPSEAWILVLPSVSLLMELGLKAYYLSYVERVFSAEYASKIQTSTHFNFTVLYLWKYVPEQLQIVFSVYNTAIVPYLLGLFITVTCLRNIREDDPMYQEWSNVFILWLMALLPFFLFPGFEHVKANLFALRYSVVSIFFAAIACIWTFWLVLSKWKPITRNVTLFLVATVAVRSTMVSFVKEYPIRNQAYRTELSMAQKVTSVDLIYIGGYDVYQLQCLNKHILGLPIQGQTMRMPWYIEIAQKEGIRIISDHDPDFFAKQSQYGMKFFAKEKDSAFMIHERKFWEYMPLHK